jgi:unsaturated rhamnogalacturonyl hydrolase
MLRRVADRTRRFDFTVWFWGDPVAFDGLLEATALLGEPRYAEHAEKYLRPWCEGGVVTWVDVNCPGHALTRLFELTGRELYLHGAERLADHLHNRVPRSLEPECPIYQPDRATHRNYAWVDTIYHLPPFFCNLAKVTGNPKYYDQGMYVMRTHVNSLLDRGSLLFPQGCDLATGLQRGYGWGRGMGWAYLGIIDTYALLPANYEERRWLRELFLQLSIIVLGYQHYTGAWRNLIHDPESPLEASTAALLGAAFEKGVRLGLLGDEYKKAANRAWGYVTHHIDEHGGFFNVSACSWAEATPADDTDLYKRFYTEVNVWGQGSAMRAAAERVLAETVLAAKKEA